MAWNVLEHIHKSMPLVPILSQMNPIHILYLRSILILSYHVHLELRSGLLLSHFIIITTTTTTHQLGLDIPVMASSNSLFKCLPNRLRLFGL
jgi:hypothetical protein